MIRLSGPGGALPFYYKLMDYGRTDTRLILREGGVDSDIFGGGTVVLLMEGFIVVKFLEISANVLISGWRSYLGGWGNSVHPFMCVGDLRWGWVRLVNVWVGMPVERFICS